MPYVLAVVAAIVLLVILAGCKPKGSSGSRERGSISAMCYVTAPPRGTAEYVCPRCGQRTVYVVEETPGPGATVRDLQACRRLLKEVPSFDAELDESQFCGTCSPGVKVPVLVLAVPVPGRPVPHRTAGVTADDLQLLKEYVSQSPTHVEPDGHETPFAGHLQRIEQLLGVGR